MRITAQECISILDATKKAADGNILYRAFMLVSSFRFVPGAFVLVPRNHVWRSRQVNVHVCPAKFSDCFHFVSPRLGVNARVYRGRRLPAHD